MANQIRAVLVLFSHRAAQIESMQRSRRIISYEIIRRPSMYCWTIDKAIKSTHK